MKTEVLNITPEMAKEFLKKNLFKNRPINEKHVDECCDAMLRGQWKLTGQAIQFSEFGNLIDGQHRLSALIKADVTLPFLVVYEVRESVFDVLDQGKNRSGSDVLAISGATNTGTSSAIIRAYLYMRKTNTPSLASNLTRYKSLRSYKVTNTDVLKFYNENTEACDYAVKVAKASYHKFKVLGRTVYGSLFLYLTKSRMHSEDKVVNFFKQLSTGADITCNSIILLRQKLINDTASKIYYIDGKTKNKMLAQTWNDYLTGKNDRARLIIDHEKTYNYL